MSESDHEPPTHPRHRTDYVPTERTEEVTDHHVTPEPHVTASGRMSDHPYGTDLDN